MNIDRAVKHYQEGMVHCRNGKHSLAERAFKKAIKINPGYADAHNDLGNLYLAMGRFKESFNAYRRALNFAQDHPLILNNIGNVLMRQGEFDKACKWLNRAVEQDPDNAAIHCNLGNALQGSGKHADAVTAYRRAIELNPRQAYFYQNLGKALIQTEQLDEALDCFNELLKLDPEDQHAYKGLGDARRAQGDLEQAVSAYQMAIAGNPENAKAYSGLGGVYSDHGEIDKAISALQKAIEIDPGLTSAYQVLARNKTFTSFDAELKSMENLYAQRGLTDSKKCQLAFALGKAYEDLGEFDRSMEFVIEATRIKRGTFSYSIADSRAEFEAIKAVFSPDFLSSCADFGEPDQTPIFVLGMPRSGTSLVEQILASHPDVFGAGELTDLPNVYKTIDNPVDDTHPDIFPQRMVGLNPDAFANLGRQYVEKIRKHAPESMHVVDKLPHNFRRIGFIRAILPRARIIHCIRDPLDNCLSLFKTDFQAGHPYSYDLLETGQYYRLYLDLMDYWKTNLPGFIYDLDYEELVRDQEAQTRRLLQHCGLPWSDSCLEFHKTRRKVRTASNAQVKRPIYQGSVNLWARYEKHLQPLISALNE
jgi:tetratricopeptide (TPR) repeat protein